jgi:predicted Ser/Thr protein kinase
MFKRPDRDAATEEGSVTPERFGQIRAIFEAALDLPENEREEYAVTACAGDAGLLKEVEAMLDAEAGTDRLLDGQTPAATPSSDISSSAPDEGRFPAGTVLAGRYRVLGLLGKGGMGEVYRAFDIILNQTVALKFLSESRFAEAALVRFRNEVRIARQVSHPNVCRVYDLGMVDGLHFLSMEYIDGEDLSSLLRRIGRLPQDKAMEFTRKICAGLSAAHERGVLHRDLKPANIMIDGKGRVRIMDFGLAGLVDEIPLSDLRSGTPAYMAPEQKAGKEVTVRSDIYALGLVLHEMFTGQVYRSDSQSGPTDIVGDLDPAIERLILRCLEDDPSRRPGSALRVAMALPGADPVAAALAAGETPSPEMVAASEEKEGFSRRTAALCFVVIVVSTVLMIVVAGRIGPIARMPLPFEPEVLNFQIQELLAELGYSEPPADTASGFICCDSRFTDYLDGFGPEEQTAILAGHRPPTVQFWYRQHREALDRSEVWHVNVAYWGITLTSPPNAEPGMIRVRTDPAGRLVSLEVEPWTSTGTGPDDFDWTRLFEAAGLERNLFSEVDPRRIPPMTNDSQRAWTGTYGGGREETVRVEAASWRGQPVLFEVDGLPGSPDLVPSLRSGSAPLGNNLGTLLASIGVLILAWFNWRANRIDRRGALVIFAMSFALRIGGGAFNYSLVSALLAAMIYLAIEPHARRHWPDSLISWSRVAQGRLRNPLVASHILAAIVFAHVILWPVNLAASTLGRGPATPLIWTNPTGSLALYALELAQGLFIGLALLALVVLARLVIRKTRLADVLAALTLALGGALTLTQDARALAFAIPAFMAVFLASIGLIRRFGLLSILAATTVMNSYAFTGLTASGWMAEQLIALALVPVALAAWALWVILSARQSPDSNVESA